MRRLLPLLLLVGALLAGCEEDTGWIFIQNDTLSPIVSVTIDRCDASSTPGPDRLAPGTIPPADREGFELEFGCYEVNATTADDRFGNWRVELSRSNRSVVLFIQEV